MPVKCGGMPFTGRILVTGAAGFIGSAVAWGLNQQGSDRLVLVDRLGRSEKWRNLASLRFEDYLDADDLFAALERGALDEVHTVFHLGACSSTTETDASYLMRNNVDYTRRLAAWALGRGARFLYASSAATYGALEGELDETIPLDQLRPLNMYGYSKHLFDRYADRLGYLQQAVGLKYFNVFGPNEDHKDDMRSMVHKAFHQIRDTGRVRLFRSHRPEFADGEQRRDFIYVKDAVAMTLHLAATPSAHGLYNIGAGVAHTWIDLVTAVFAALDRPPQIDFIDMPEALRGKYQYSTCAAIGRLRRSGYTAAVTPLSAAIADYVRGYLLHDRRLGDETLAAARPAVV